MDIEWVPRKSLNITRVNELLEISLQKNHFTNGGPNVKLLEERIRECL